MRQAMWLVLCDFSPHHFTCPQLPERDYQACWQEWLRTREERIERCIKEHGPGHRPFAYWVWDAPDVDSQRERNESDPHLLHRCGLLPKDEEATVRRSDPGELKDPPGEVVEFPE